MNFNKPTLVTITAPTCSGKNFLRDVLEQDLDFARIVGTTTRAPRAGEINGQDYHFLDEETSQRFEDSGLFAELIEFRGVKYGVTKGEMKAKMAGPKTPVIILEPNGVQIYRGICKDLGFDIFTIYVHAVETLRLERLLRRTLIDYSRCVRNVDSENVIKTHLSREQSIIGEERSWSNTCLWDAIVPGDNILEAVQMVQQGIKYRNSRNEAPSPYVDVNLEAA